MHIRCFNNSDSFDSTKLFIVIWSLKIYYLNSFISLRLKLLTLVLLHLNSDQSFIIFNQDIIEHLKLFWVMIMIWVLICGVLVVFLLNFCKETLFLLGKVKLNNFYVLWKYVELHLKNFLINVKGKNIFFYNNGEIKV